MKQLEKINKAYKEYPYIDLAKINFNYYAHFHEEIEVVYVVSGNTVLTIDTVSYPLSEGDIFIVMPGEIHSFLSDSSNFLYVMKIYTDHNFLFCKIDGKITKNHSYYKIFKDIISNIALEDSERKEGYTYAVNMNVNNLILQIIRTLNPEKISPQHRDIGQRKHDFLKNVNDYLNQHYQEQILLDDISKQLKYSKYYFSHLFKEITNQSFVEFLTVFRLKKSLIHLMSGSTVTQVALDCGFNSLRSYNRCFKKYYNTTPLKYKQLNLQEE